MNTLSSSVCYKIPPRLSTGSRLDHRHNHHHHNRTHHTMKCIHNTPVLMHSILMQQIFSELHFVLRYQVSQHRLALQLDAPLNTTTIPVARSAVARRADQSSVRTSVVNSTTDTSVHRDFIIYCRSFLHTLLATKKCSLETLRRQLSNDHWGWLAKMTVKDAERDFGAFEIKNNHYAFDTWTQICGKVVFYLDHISSLLSFQILSYWLLQSWFSAIKQVLY